MKSNFSGVRAIIFDMDGVLFLSGDSHTRAFQEVLKDIGIFHFSYASIAGMRTDDAMRKVITENGLYVSEDDIAEMVRLKRSLAIDLLLENGRIVSGSDFLLKKLSSRYRLALASSASPKTVELFLKMSGCKSDFDFCIDGSMVSEAKPSPEIYLIALKRLNMAPEECIVIEDAISGVRAARDAGIRVLGVAGTESAEDLLSAGVEIVVSDVLAIEGILMNK